MTECREVEQTLSAMFDGEPVDDAARIEAEAHCAACPGCASFRRALDTLRDVPSPRAPAGLAERIASTAATVSREVAAEQARESLHPDEPDLLSADVTEKVPWLTRNRVWAWTAALGTAAALAVFAIVAGTGMMGGDASSEREVQQALTKALSDQGAPAARAGAARPRLGATERAPSPSRSPDYVSYSGAVYVAAGPIDASSSQLTTAGTISTSLGGERLQTVTVYRPSATASASIAVRYPDGSLNLFQPVTRTYADRAYRLMTGTPLSHFGQWPDLPRTFTPPSADDGSPTFRVADPAAAVFVTIGGDACRGIAIAPGRPSSDPSAGNPNWTWWEP